ncbi:MAG: hypothetical protein Q9213_005692 [Squamulea squamosa]
MAKKKKKKTAEKGEAPVEGKALMEAKAPEGKGKVDMNKLMDLFQEGLNYARGICQSVRIDATPFHRFKKNTMRLFFEALCIRLGEVKEFKRLIGECKDSNPYLALQRLCAKITAREYPWVVRTSLDRKYLGILKDTAALLDACQGLIDQLSDEKNATGDNSQKKHTNDKVHKDTIDNGDADIEPTGPTCLGEQYPYDETAYSRGEYFGSKKLSWVTEQLYIKEYEDENCYEDELWEMSDIHIIEDTFKTPNDILNTLLTESQLFAQLLSAHKDEDDFWADQYQYFGPLFAYIYRGPHFENEPIEMVAGMDLETLRKRFPKGMDLRILNGEQRSMMEK